MCVGPFSRPSRPDPPPVPAAPTPPPTPQEVQQAPAPEPVLPEVGELDLKAKKKKATVVSASSKKKKAYQTKGTSAYVSQATEGTGLQTISGTQQGLNTGTPSSSSGASTGKKGKYTAPIKAMVKKIKR